MNKLGVVVFSLAIVSVLAIVISITLTADRNRNNEGFVADGDPISLEEFITSKFSPSYFNGSWWSSHQLQWRDEVNNLVVWDVETQETSLLVSSDTVGLVSSSATFIAFGKNKSLLLFKDDVESVWRHSFLAQYFVLDVTKNETLAVTPMNLPDGTKLQYAQWVPQTDKVAYVFGNDIYIRDILNGGEDVQITSDGVIDTIYNGIPDWVYEEEILSTNKAMYFTPSGSKMAFARFNDEDVQEFYYTKYGSPEDPYKVQYPQEIMLKYPKVGTSNPSVSLWVSDLTASNQVPVPVTPPQDVSEGHLYTAAKWVSEDVLSIIWTNRVQNESSVSICKQSSKEWLCETVTSPIQHNGWLDVFQPPFYKSDGNSFLQILPQKLPGKELHYNHIKLHNPQTQESYFITNGEFVVISILRWNEDEDEVYFMGTGERDAGARQLYSAKTDRNVLIQCITCELRTVRGDLCKYNQVSFNNDASYYIHTCLGPNIPEVVLRSIADDQAVKYVFETNQLLEEQLSSKALSEKMNLKVSVGGDREFEAPVLLKLPKGYDVNEKYPLLVYVYGGPESQNVDQRWKLGYEDYLTSNYGIVYAMIDGRGTGYQSNEYKFEVYHQLGTVEMLDQISVTKELLSRFPFLDETRTGIWGWSYGGYATAMTLIKDTENIFKCGLSTAPPTNWLFYDSFYTERYMGLPTIEDNMDGYNASSLLDKVDKLKGKKFQLNHGVADDNVHYQQSMLFIRALELADIPFEQHSYPDENHSLRGVKPAVYHNFNKFWTQCFNLQK